MCRAASPCCPDDPPDSLKTALDLGISLFAGEAEGRFDELLQDAHAGALKPIYNFLDNLPHLQGATLPSLPADRIRRNLGFVGSFDAGRGCPFHCSFCTIINVQGRKSRYRDADDVERLMRDYQAQGIKYFMITDDNLARNRNWEAIFDRLIALRQQGIKGRFIIQVDTACHKIPGFIEKAAARRREARVHRAREHQPRQPRRGQEEAEPYRRLPGDAAGLAESPGHHLLRLHTRISRRHAGDRSCATSRSSSANCRSTSSNFPCSRRCRAARTIAPWSPRRAIDPDLNKYDLEHVVADHPRMSRAEWQQAYRQAWSAYYNEEHVITVIRRAAASGFNVDTMLFLLVVFWASWEFYNIYPLEVGLVRRKSRLDRRPGLPIENALTFYAGQIWRTIAVHVRLAGMLLRLFWIAQKIKRDPNARAYRDLALTPQSGGDVENLELFQLTDGARQAGAKATHLARKLEKT